MDELLTAAKAVIGALREARPRVGGLDSLTIPQAAYLWAPKGKKHPTYPWRDLPGESDPIVLGEWLQQGRNLLVVLGSRSGNLVHLDFDGIVDFIQLACRWKNARGLYPWQEAPVQRTRRGLHIVLQMDPPPRKKILLFQGTQRVHQVELLGEKCLAMVPPSRMGGRRYTWLNGIREPLPVTLEDLAVVGFELAATDLPEARKQQGTLQVRGRTDRGHDILTSYKPPTDATQAHFRDAFADLEIRAGESVQLAGGDEMFRCPWHDDHHPSLAIRWELCLFHCFGCGRGGGPSAILGYEVATLQTQNSSTSEMKLLSLRETDAPSPIGLEASNCSVRAICPDSVEPVAGEGKNVDEEKEPTCATYMVPVKGRAGTPAEGQYGCIRRPCGAWSCPHCRRSHIREIRETFADLLRHHRFPEQELALITIPTPYSRRTVQALRRAGADWLSVQGEDNTTRIVATTRPWARAPRFSATVENLPDLDRADAALHLALQKTPQERCHDPWRERRCRPVSFGGQWRRRRRRPSDWTLWGTGQIRSLDCESVDQLKQACAAVGVAVGREYRSQENSQRLSFVPLVVPPQYWTSDWEDRLLERIQAVLKRRVGRSPPIHADT